MQGLSVDSLAKLRTCDYRLQDIFGRASEQFNMTIEEGYIPDVGLCPSKTIKVRLHLPDTAKDHQRGFLMMLFLGYMEGLAKGLGHELDADASYLNSIASQLTQPGPLPDDLLVCPFELEESD